MLGGHLLYTKHYAYITWKARHLIPDFRIKDLKTALYIINNQIQMKLISYSTALNFSNTLSHYMTIFSTITKGKKVI